MTRHFDERAVERAAPILRVAKRYSGDELDDAVKAPVHPLLSGHNL
jgi:hypothetical protein